MKITIRLAILLAITVWFAPSALASPENYLLGTFVVRCPNGHDDTVTKGTAQHVCEKCGTQTFRGGKVTVVCPHGHPNEVTLHGQTKSIICSVCKTECRRN
jgi:hypothetical protein